MAQISEVMTRGVRTLAPQDSIVRAAQAMQELDVGSIPVCDGRRLVGMVTDRDIVLRAVAQNKVGDDTHLDAIMSGDPCWCFEDQGVDEVLETMRSEQLRRLPVVDRQKHLVGIVSLGDLARQADEQQVGEALEGISEPGASGGRGVTRAPKARSAGAKKVAAAKNTAQTAGTAMGPGDVSEFNYSQQREDS